MKLALPAGNFRPEYVEAVHEAERLGYDSLWSSENYGNDCFSQIGWWAAQTQTIRLGTVVAILDARTPTCTAMTAMTLDRLSNGRYTLGLGVSGPKVVEGWYGRPFPRPLARTREYVEIVRKTMAREEPVTFDGEFYQLPFRGGTGLGAPLKAIGHPVRTNQPILLAAEGPANVALAAEVADGWTATYMSPASDSMYAEFLDRGFARRPGGRPDDFQVIGQVYLSIDDDVEVAADAVRPHLALMVGGMGAPGNNFHYDAMVRVGFESECAEVQRRWSEGDRGGAAKAVTTEMVEATALVGPLTKLRDDFSRWDKTAITTMLPIVMSGPIDVATVTLLAEAAWSR